MAETIQESKNNKVGIGMFKMSGSMVEDLGVSPASEKAIAMIAGSNLTNTVPTLACKTSKRAAIDNCCPILEAEEEADGIELFNTEIENYGFDPDPPSWKRKLELPPPQKKESQEEEIIIGEELDEPEPELEPEPEPEPESEAQP